jgi:hypothetical protein
MVTRSASGRSPGGRAGRGPHARLQRPGKAIPYGIYDLAHDEGWVSVGVDHDTAQFAVASIQGWWEDLGHERSPAAHTLTITADCGGSNGYRTRLWKTELQRLADHTGLQIRVCH